MIKQFLISSLWYFVLLFLCLLFLLFDREVYFFISGVAFLITFLPRMGIFFNHYYNSRNVSICLNIEKKFIRIKRKNNDTVIPYSEIECIQHHLSGSLYSGLSGQLPSTWEDFFYVKILLINKEYFCISCLVFKNKYFEVYGIKKEKKLALFPFIRNLHGP